MPVHITPSLAHPPVYTDRDRGVVSFDGAKNVQALIRQCPAYRETPLESLPGLAKELCIGSLHYKDEAFRFDLNSFKSLGGTYAVGMVLLQYLHAQGNSDANFKTLAEGGYKDLVSNLTVSCASAGNHGRAIAAGARHFGCRAMIFLPENTAPERTRMIRETGAKVISHSGTYDETLRVAEQTVQQNG